MGEKQPILDYSTHRPERRPAGSSALVGIAYALIALPIVCSVFVNSDAPASIVEMPCSIAVAFGASLYVVRRRRDNVIGWIGLLLWGLATLSWIVVPLLGK